MRCFARVTRGLEWVAAAEVAGRLGAEVHAVEHREVHFTTTAPVAAVLDLRTVDDAFLLVDRIEGIGRHRADVARLDRLSSTAAARALAVVREARDDPDLARFDVTGSALGTRNFNRYDLEDAVGEALRRAVGGTYVARDRATGRGEATGVSWRVHVRDDTAVVGLRLGTVPLHRRAYKTSSVVGTLHPPVAAALALLAGVEPGRWLLDPCCGAGTVVAEHALLAEAAAAGAGSVDPIAGDLDGGSAAGTARTDGRATGIGVDRAEGAVVAARSNLVAADVASTVVRGDAARLPLASGSFDRIVTNPPWDRRLHLDGDGDLAAVWQELARVAADDARLVVLSELALPAPPGFRAAADLLPLRVMGSQPTVRVFTAPGAADGPLPPPSSWLTAELARFHHLADTR